MKYENVTNVLDIVLPRTNYSEKFEVVFVSWNMNSTDF